MHLKFNEKYKHVFDHSNPSTHHDTLTDTPHDECPDVTHSRVMDSLQTANGCDASCADIESFHRVQYLILVVGVTPECGYRSCVKSAKIQEQKRMHSVAIMRSTQKTRYQNDTQRVGRYSYMKKKRVHTFAGSGCTQMLPLLCRQPSSMHSQIAIIHIFL